MSTFITKNNQKALPNTVDKAKAEAARRDLLNKIKHGEDVEDFEPEVGDIAFFVQNQLHLGWKTDAKPK